MEPVVAGDAAPIVAAFVGFLEEHTDDWDVLIVRRLHPDAEIGQILGQALRGSTLRARAHDDEAYLTVPTDGGWQGVLASRSAKSRAAMSRQLKKLDAEIRGGKLRAEVVERPDLQPSLLDRMAELEARRAKRGVPAGSLVAAYRPFFADVFAALGPRGHLYVSTVEFEGALIAYELGFRGPTAIMAYTRAFDIAHAKLVPGVLLSRLGVEFSVRSGAVEYDFLRGAEEFKRRLGGQPRALLRLDVWSHTRRSRVAALLYFRLRRRALRAVALLPLVQIDTQDL
jgi:CelD/BcsL family acetyltransferase involved in cellulose biosynthesis